jgi:hypothetical protein
MRLNVSTVLEEIHLGVTGFAELAKASKGCSQGGTATNCFSK